MCSAIPSQLGTRENATDLGLGAAVLSYRDIFLLHVRQLLVVVKLGSKVAIGLDIFTFVVLQRLEDSGLG